MATKTLLILDKLTSDPKGLFLIDGFGALLSAFFLAGILAPFEEVFGMPPEVLYFLAMLASILAVYSICCYLFINNNYRTFQKIIAFANLIYCCITLGLVIFFFQRLTVLGQSYFLIEIIVVSVLIFIELTQVYKPGNRKL